MLEQYVFFNYQIWKTTVYFWIIVNIIYVWSDQVYYQKFGESYLKYFLYNFFNFNLNTNPKSLRPDDMNFILIVNNYYNYYNKLNLLNKILLH